MQTTCPNCKTAFRVTAGQLKIAQGKVRCGGCMEIFNAIEFLVDDEGRPARPGGPAGLESWPYERATPDRSGQQEVSKPSPTPDEPPALPALLRETVSDGRGTSWLWGLGALLLCAALLVQYALFDQERAFESWPELRPWAERLCGYIPCRIQRRFDPESIRLITRDVRGHPDVAGALLINATMLNSTEYDQDWPLMEFTLYDTSGNRTAARRFLPDEYLDAGMSIDAGMPPQHPVHFVLELVGKTTRGAVSYEFEFLDPRRPKNF